MRWHREHRHSNLMYVARDLEQSIVDRGTPQTPNTISVGVKQMRRRTHVGKKLSALIPLAPRGAGRSRGRGVPEDSRLTGCNTLIALGEGTRYTWNHKYQREDKSAVLLTDGNQLRISTKGPPSPNKASQLGRREGMGRAEEWLRC